MPFPAAVARTALLLAWSIPASGLGAATQVVVVEDEAAPDGNGDFALFGEPLFNNAGQVAFFAELTDTTALTNTGIFRGTGSALTQIAREGNDAPDADGDLSLFGDPSFNDSGQVAFSGVLTSTTAQTDTGIFRSDGTTLTQIARKGDAAPDGNGDLSLFGDPLFSDSGQVAFSAELTGTTALTRSGLFRGTGTTLTQIARGGDIAPDGNGNLATFGNHLLNDAGQVAFFAELTNATGFTDTGIFRGDGTTRVQIVRENATAPDGNGNFSTFGDPLFNDAGQVAFFAGLTNAMALTDTGIFRGDGTILTRIARENDPAPDGNGDLSTFGDPLLNDAGQVAFFAGLINATTLTDTGIFRGDGSNLTQIAREDDAAPDGNGDLSTFGDPLLNDAGQVAFFAALRNASPLTDSGIFRGEGSTLTQVARENDSAPDGNGDLSTFGDPLLNDAGQVAFFAGLTNASPLTDTGIYFFDDVLGLLQVAREGDPLLGSTITGLSLRSAATLLDDNRDGLNESGQVAYSFALDDGRSGIAIWSPVLAGDYNNDGAVDAADYTAWRDHLGGPAGTLPNDVDGGVIDADQYATWKANFGASLPAALAISTVPEPSAVLLLGCAMLMRWRAVAVILVAEPPQWVAGT